MEGFSYSIEYYRDRIDELEAEVERLTKAGAAWCEQAKQCEAKIEAALAIVRRLKEMDQPWAGLGIELEKALTE